MAAPSTPIRAITNSLSLRSTPSIPPASQTYEPLIKAVLRHRLLFRIFLFSAVFTWAVVVANGIYFQGGIRHLGFIGTLLGPVRPTTLFLAVGTWCLGVLPILVLRKTYLTAAPAIASSPSQVFRTAASKKSTIHALITFTATATIVMILHVLTAYAYEPTLGTDPGLTLFVKSKKHPYYLNGRTLYITLSQLMLALLYFSRNVMLDRFTVRWTASLFGNDVQTFRLARMFTGALTMVLLATMSTVLHTTIFGLGRSFVLPIVYKLPIVPRLLRPFTAHFLRGPLSITLLFRNWSLIRRAYTLGLITVVNWEFAEQVFDSYIAEPIAVAQITADPALTLVSGITASSTYFQHFAFSELKHLATDPSQPGIARRTALFVDQKYNPTLWSSLVRSTLLILGNDYQIFLRRGASAPPPSEEKKEEKKEMPKIPSTPLMKTNVLKQPRQSPLKSALETFAADGAIASAVAASAEIGASQLPELFRSVMPEKSPVFKKVEATVEKVKQGEEEAEKVVKEAVSAGVKGKWKENLYAEVERWTPRWIEELKMQFGDWWRRERLSRIVEGSLPHRKMDTLAIESLCGFICASLTEDRYGVVQRDIPRILEALISFLIAIEEFQTELITKYPQRSPEELQKLDAKELAAVEQQKEEVAKAGETLGEVGDALKAGLVQISQTFGNRLSAFKFPPRIAKKLQGFVDYT